MHTQIKSFRRGKKLIFFLFCCLSFSSFLLASQEDYGRLLEHAHKLPSYGVLTQRGGFVYVKVDEAYITELLSFCPDFLRPYYVNYPDFQGAHITVITECEWDPVPISFNQIITFQIQGCKVIKLSSQPDEALILQVHSKELEDLRALYELPSPQYPFHITVGFKPLDFSCALPTEEKEHILLKSY